MQILSGVLYLYSWLVFAFVLVILFLIARFYQEKSGQRSNYRWFLLPSVGFVASAVGRFAMPSWPVFEDVLLLSAGITLGVLSWRLLARMTRDRR